MDVAHLAARDPAVVLVDTSVDPGPDLALKGGAAGIPVVSLPPGVSFHQLNMLVAEHNLAQKAHVTEYGIMVHESLSRILYTGAGLRAMARQISVISRRPVLVTDVHFAVLAHSQSSTGSSRSLATRDLADAMDRATVDIHLSADPGAGHAQASLRRLAVGSTSLWAVLAPILFGGTVYGWVAVIGDKDEPGAHDLAQHLVAVTQGAIVVGAEMLRIRSMREAEERARGDFIDALLHSRFADARELAARAASQGFDLDATYGVAIAQGGAPVGATGSVERSISLQRNIEALLPRRDPPGWVTAVGRNLVAVVPVI
ncbi:MAG: PucR family transcriptional regulator, partial [Acidimicrobiales bacterium]